MKVRWIGMLSALLPILCQLTWLSDWQSKGDPHIANMSYFILCLIAGAIGAKFGLRDVGPWHWSKDWLRFLTFLGIVSLEFSVGFYSGCSFF